MYGNPTAYSLDFVKISDRHNHHILLDRTGRTKPAIYMNQ
jgi:hypothetical protein